MDYELSEKQIEQVTKAFTYHAPKGNQPERYENIRSTFAALALGICQSTPQSREQSLALTKLEECHMWVNAAIARNE